MTSFFFYYTTFYNNLSSIKELSHHITNLTLIFYFSPFVFYKFYLRPLIKTSKHRGGCRWRCTKCNLNIVYYCHGNFFWFWRWCWSRSWRDFVLFFLYSLAIEHSLEFTPFGPFAICNFTSNYTSFSTGCFNNGVAANV